jgi:hypothetical protein
MEWWAHGVAHWGGPDNRDVTGPAAAARIRAFVLVTWPGEASSSYQYKRGAHKNWGNTRIICRGDANSLSSANTDFWGDANTDAENNAFANTLTDTDAFANILTDTNAFADTLNILLNASKLIIQQLLLAEQVACLVQKDCQNRLIDDTAVEDQHRPAVGKRAESEND